MDNSKYNCKLTVVVTNGVATTNADGSLCGAILGFSALAASLLSHAASKNNDKFKDVVNDLKTAVDIAAEHIRDRDLKSEPQED